MPKKSDKKMATMGSVQRAIEHDPVYRKLYDKFNSHDIIYTGTKATLARAKERRKAAQRAVEVVHAAHALLIDLLMDDSVEEKPGQADVTQKLKFHLCGLLSKVTKRCEVASAAEEDRNLARKNYKTSVRTLAGYRREFYARHGLEFPDNAPFSHPQ